MHPLECRFCNSALKHTFLDFGMSPNAVYLHKNELYQKIVFYPLHLFVCDVCLLVQLPGILETKQHFDNYVRPAAPLSPYSTRSSEYAHQMISLFGLDDRSCVVEIAGNDEYLLKCFREARISVLAIEPGYNGLQRSELNKVPRLAKTFNRRTAAELSEEGVLADLLMTNEVLPHAPDVHDFFTSVKTLLKPSGTLVIDVPHLSSFICNNRFDLFYHDCLSYFSLFTLDDILFTHGLELFDAEDFMGRGRMLRIYVRHAANGSGSFSQRLRRMKENEIQSGLNQLDGYLRLCHGLREAKRRLLGFLFEIKERGQSVACYGVSVRGNTFLNYCGIGSDLIDYTVDLNPALQNHFLAGTNIPILHPDRISETKPDYLLILSLGGRDEIIEQVAFVREWGGQFIVPVPEMEVLS